MIRLESSSGEVLSRILKEVSPITYTSNKQINKLLDGSYHVQIMGGPLRSTEGTIIASFKQADKINELIDEGTPLVFVFLDKKYIVYIEEAIKWKRVNFAHGNMDKSFFEGSVQMIIKEEVLS